MEAILIILVVLLSLVCQVKMFSILSSWIEKQAQDLSEALKRIDKVIKENHNLVTASEDAIIQSLSRIDCFEEFKFIDMHYETIKKLLFLRRSGYSEENIIKQFMKYEKGRGLSSYQGWKVPRVNPSTGKREILIISPYWIATRGGNLARYRKLQNEAANMGTFGFFSEDEWSDAEVVEFPVCYENENGDIVEYPSGKVSK